MVKMSPLANRKPRQMSGGQQQRVALARALVNRPSLLLLDEPLGALDRKLREEMQIELKLIQSQVGTTFIFVTHDQQEALSMSDRIAVMLDGRVEQLADPDTIYDSPAIGVRRRVHRPAELLRRHGPRDRARGPGRRMDDPRERRAPDASTAAAPSPPSGRRRSRSARRSRTNGENAVSRDARQHLAPGRRDPVRRHDAGAQGDPRPAATTASAQARGRAATVWCAWDAEHTHVFSAEQADDRLGRPGREPATSNA